MSAQTVDGRRQREEHADACPCGIGDLLQRLLGRPPVPGVIEDQGHLVLQRRCLRAQGGLDLDGIGDLGADADGGAGPVEHQEPVPGRPHRYGGGLARGHDTPWCGGDDRGRCDLRPVRGGSRRRVVPGMVREREHRDGREHGKDDPGNHNWAT